MSVKKFLKQLLILFIVSLSIVNMYCLAMEGGEPPRRPRSPAQEILERKDAAPRSVSEAKAHPRQRPGRSSLSSSSEKLKKIDPTKSEEEQLGDEFAALLEEGESHPDYEEFYTLSNLLEKYEAANAALATAKQTNNLQLQMKKAQAKRTTAEALRKALKLPRTASIDDLDQYEIFKLMKKSS